MGIQRVPAYRKARRLYVSLVDRLFPYHRNRRTRLMVALLKDMRKAAGENGRKFYVAGGIGLEIEAASNRGDSHLTRHHEDLDILAHEQDMGFWRGWFESRGYSITQYPNSPDLARGFVAHSPGSQYQWDAQTRNGYYVDLSAFALDEDGFHHEIVEGKDVKWAYTFDEAIVECHWHGGPISVLRHEILLEVKRYYAALGMPYREHDFHDYVMFGLVPPQN